MKNGYKQEPIRTLLFFETGYCSKNSVEDTEEIERLVVLYKNI